jgi:hypothetical protein
MSILKGKDGQVILDSTAVIQIRAWRIDATAALLDGTALGDDYKVKVTSFIDWKGTMDLIWDPQDTDHAALQTNLLAGTSIAAAKFYVDGTHYYSGEIFITGISPNVPVADLVTAAVTFEGSGAMSYA